MDTDAQTILLLAFREHQPHRVIAQIARCSEPAISYKTPAALAQLARLLDRASLLQRFAAVLVQAPCRPIRSQVKQRATQHRLSALIDGK